LKKIEKTVENKKKPERAGFLYLVFIDAN